MTRGKLLDRIAEAFTLVAIGALVGVAAGWAANRLGILPPAAEPFARPLLVVAGLAVCVAEGFSLARDLLRRTLLRWTCAAVAVMLSVMVLVEAGASARLWKGDSTLAFTVLLATVPLLAAGLFADAVRLRRRGVSRLGPAGAASGGLGLLGYALGVSSGIAWPMLAALPLLAFGGYALFRVRGELTVPLPAAAGRARLPAGDGGRGNLTTTGD
jgi:hypothetical protein